MPTRLAFDGENVWVAYASYDIPDSGPLKKLPDRDLLTKLDMDGRQVENYRIGLTDSPDSAAGPRFNLDAIIDLAFDGENIWVSHRTVGPTKLALDGTELWTTPGPGPPFYEQLIHEGSRTMVTLLHALTTLRSDKRLIFAGDKMVILGNVGVPRRPF